jgi:hypothetical protein
MHFPTAAILQAALAALPFLVAAVPVENLPRDVISLPLSKRSTFHNADGVVDIAKFQAGMHHIMEFVLTVLLKEKCVSSYKGVYLENTSADSKPSKGTPVNATPSRGSWSIRTGAATTLRMSLSLLSVLRLGRGLLVSRLELPPKILLVSHYFRVAQPSKLIT